MREIIKEFPKEEASLMELMPAWSRKGYEKGIQQGIEQGIELGKGEVIRKLLSKGFTPEEVAQTIDLPLEEIQRIAESH